MCMCVFKLTNQLFGHVCYYLTLVFLEFFFLCFVVIHYFPRTFLCIYFLVHFLEKIPIGMNSMHRVAVERNSYPLVPMGFLEFPNNSPNLKWLIYSFGSIRLHSILGKIATELSNIRFDNYYLPNS